MFAAEDANRQPCALKTLDRRAPPTALAVARFAMECRIHRLASDCPGVLPMHADVDPRWLVLAWAHGGSVAELIEARVRPSAPADRVMSIVRSLLVAAAAVHSRGIVHRDIKPSNILLDGPRVWLADFGVSGTRQVDGSWQGLPAPWKETEVGTPGWVAPELVANPHDIQPANDVFSIGQVWTALAAWAGGETAATAGMRARFTTANPAARPSATEAVGWLTP